MNFDWIKTRSDFDEIKPAVIDPLKGTEWSYQDLNVRADNLANYLKSQGITRGDVVGIFAPNDVAILDLMFAAFKMGVVFLPINWRLNPKEIKAIIDDSEVKLIFYVERHLPSLSLIDKNLLHMDIDSDEYNEITNPDTHTPYQAVKVEGDNLAALFYTSGTTGMPKGVMFSYDSFVNNGTNIELTYKLNSNHKTILAIPMFHVFGLNDTVLPLLMAGGTLVLERYFEGKELNNLMAKYKPNFLSLIPTMYYSMLTVDNFDIKNFENIEFLIQGGSAPLPSVQEAFKKMGYYLINGYGLTEAPLVMVNTPENAKKKPLSVGKQVMFVDVRILDEDHNDVENNEIGELAVKAKNITPGYWNKPEETKKNMYDGYLLTGDLAKVDADGDIFIIDRKKELIITGGENVLPSEVETALAKHPLVDRCVVVGYDSPKYGESIGAAVILTEDDPDFKEKLNTFMRENLAGYKVPRLYKQVREMPLNSTAKPDKIAIKKIMNELAQEQVTESQ